MRYYRWTGTTVDPTRRTKQGNQVEETTVGKIINGILAVVLIGGMGVVAWKACATDEPPKQTETKPTGDAGAAPGSGDAAPAAGGEAAAGGDCCKADDTTPPLDLIKATPKHGLHNPYNDKIDAIAAEGQKKYLSAGCNGCHGGGGGGGMCPPLTNDTWVYGGDDDTLFRLIALGSDELKKQGYNRVKNEVVVGPMPPFGGIIKTSDDLWKIIAFIRSKNPNSMKLVSTPAQ
jgi:mono/diheme cytochrome c family protein